MTNKNGKPLPLSRDARVLLKDLIIGKLLTLLVIGSGLFWWFKSRSEVYSSASASSSQDASTTESTFQTIADVPSSGLFNYGGSPAWAPIRQVVDSQLQSARPELQLRYVNLPESSPGSSSGLRMLLAGQLDFAQSS